MRIANFLSEQHIAFDQIDHAPAFCASRRARWLGTTGRQVAKAILLDGPEGFFVAVLRSTHEIDRETLSAHWGGPLRLAGIEEAAAIFRDCEWGSVPAFGNLYGLPVVLDAGIDPDDDIVFEVGSHFADVRLRCRDYERLTGAFRLDFVRPVKPYPTAG